MSKINRKHKVRPKKSKNISTTIDPQDDPDGYIKQKINEMPKNHRPICKFSYSLKPGEFLKSLEFFIDLEAFVGISMQQSLFERAQEIMLEYTVERNKLSPEDIPEYMFDWEYMANTVARDVMPSAEDYKRWKILNIYKEDEYDEEK